MKKHPVRCGQRDPRRLQRARHSSADLLDLMQDEALEYIGSSRFADQHTPVHALAKAAVEARRRAEHFETAVFMLLESVIEATTTLGRAVGDDVKQRVIGETAYLGALSAAVDKDRKNRTLANVFHDIAQQPWRRPAQEEGEFEKALRRIHEKRAKP